MKNRLHCILAMAMLLAGCGEAPAGNGADAADDGSAVAQAAAGGAADTVGPPPAPASPAAFALSPCRVEGSDEDVLCGTLSVPEDRAKPDGRRIGLNIVVIPAREPDASLPPLYDLAGGPGVATGTRSYRSRHG